MSKVKAKYKNILDKYLRWTEDSDNIFLPSLINKDINSLDAEVIMRDWESEGIKIPSSCNNPLLLAKYIQGKTLRDFWITQWREAVKEGSAFKQEFYYLLKEKGDDPLKVFKGVFNDYKHWFPKVTDILIERGIDPDSFFNNLDETNMEWFDNFGMN